MLRPSHIPLLLSRRLSTKQLTLLLSLLAGVGAAIAAQMLKFLIHEIEYLLTSQFDVRHANWLFLVYPVVGILLTSLFIRYVVRDDIGHGVTKILYALSRKGGQIRSQLLVERHCLGADHRLRRFGGS